MSRINYVYLLVGKRGCGKTTSAIQLANSISKRILVVNTDVNEAYDEFESITLEQLPQWNTKQAVIITNEAIEVFTLANDYVKNCTIIFEDTAKYVSQNVEQNVRRFVINHRMNNIDVILMYHALKFVPPYLAMNFNRLILYKTQDSNSADIKSKFAQYDEISIAVDKLKKSKNAHICQVIKDN